MSRTSLSEHHSVGAVTIFEFVVVYWLMQQNKRLHLLDENWVRIAPALAIVKGRYGRPAKNDRRFIEAVVWMVRTGAPWRDLPVTFGRWQTVYKRFSRWSRRGLWAALYKTLREENKRQIPGNVVASLDSTSIRVHQHGAPKRRSRQAQAVGTSRGGFCDKGACVGV